MEAGIRTRKAFAVAPVFILLFFFNTCGLPQGISLSLLLTPVWIYLLALQGRLHPLKYLLIPMMLYAVVQLLLGANAFYYAVSATLMLATGVFAFAAWPALADPFLDYERLFRRIVLVNFMLTLISLPLLFVPELKETVWYVVSMSEGLRVIPRLKLFTYEASHYSYLITPLFIFFAASLLFRGRRIQDGGFLLALICIPLLLSLSFGVLGAIFISGLLAVLIRFKAVFYSRKRLLVLFSIVLAFGVGVFLLLYVFPENMLTQRWLNIISGKDTSARGRTYESFILAHKIISHKSLLWGIGPGQLKIDGRDIIVQYYSYSRIPDSVRIPNACAEMIVCFGYLGLALRLAIQAWAFIRCRVYNDPFRLWLFLFLFIFQFAGSYVTNVTEYIFWMIACVPIAGAAAGSASHNRLTGNLSPFP